MKLVLNFKNNDVLKLDMKYIESIDASHKESGNGMILQYKSSEIPSDFFEEYSQVLVRHNLSTHVGVFSFCDVDTEVWNMSDTIPTDIAVAATKSKIVNKELQIGYVNG